MVIGAHQSQPLRETQKTPTRPERQAQKPRKRSHELAPLAKEALADLLVSDDIPIHRKYADAHTADLHPTILVGWQ